jgi:5'-3' exonuclease
MIEDFIDEEKQQEKQKVLLIDLHNLCMRHLFAQIPDPTDISYTQYKYGMLLSIRKLARTFQPDRMIFCKESIDGNWRKAIYPDYKANRASERASSVVDFDKFFEINKKFLTGLEKCMKNAQFLTVPHLEADDLIALTVMNEPNWEITLVSTDKDFYQLHSFKNFHQWDPIKEEYIQVLNPEAALMEKIVRGDRSDNIPSLKKGVGSKTFAKIYAEGLNEWLSLNMLQESFDRNTKLISFRCIPQEYKSQVKNIIEDFEKQPFDSREFFNFIIAEGIGAFMDKATEFVNWMK